MTSTDRDILMRAAGFEQLGPHVWRRPGPPSMTNPTITLHDDGTWTSNDGWMSIHHDADNDADAIGPDPRP